MDNPKLSPGAAEEWLWSLEWAKAGKARQDNDWTAVVKCLRDVVKTELGEDWSYDCAAWADLIEALVGKSPVGADQSVQDRSARSPAECH